MVSGSVSSHLQEMQNKTTCAHENLQKRSPAPDLHMAVYLFNSKAPMWIMIRQSLLQKRGTWNVIKQR